MLYGTFIRYEQTRSIHGLILVDKAYVGDLKVTEVSTAADAADSIQMKNKKERIFEICIAAVCVCLLCVITVFIEKKQLLIDYSDLSQHVNWASDMNFVKELMSFISYPLFHFIVKVMVRILNIDREFVAVFLYSVFIAVSYVICLVYWRQNNKATKADIAKTVILGFLFFLTQAIYVPAFNPSLYLGQGSINIWHNPTYAIVKPLGIIAFMLVVKLLEAVNEKKKILFTRNWWILLVLMIFCNLAKPSFSQVFIPGIGIYMIIDIIRTKGKSFIKHFQIACAFIPATILLFVQAFVTINTTMGFKWLEIWGIFSKNVFVSVLLLMAFPFYMLIWRWRELKHIDVRLSCFIFLAGFFEAAFLFENNLRKYDGNMFWGYYLGALFLWLSTMRVLLDFVGTWNKASKKDKIMCVVAFMLFAAHLGAGIYYIYKLICVPGFLY